MEAQKVGGQDRTEEHLIDELAKMRRRIAELEASETQRKREEEALRSSEERFRQLIENASDIITVVSGDGIIRYESPSVERVLRHGGVES